jgi:phosphatidate cytidylyltransferase
MDDDHLDDPTQGFDFRSSENGPDDVDVDPVADDAWSGVGARRGPRQPAEGVRIIGADEAAAAIESGQVAAKKPEDALRFGDVPPQPPGPRPSLRFPGADPSSVDKPPVAGEPRPSRDERESAAAEAARRWDEALARSTESRGRTRSSSALFGDPEDPEDLFGLSGGRTEPAPGPDRGPEPSGAASWLDEEPELLSPPGPPPSATPPWDPAAPQYDDLSDYDQAAPPAPPAPPRFDPEASVPPLQHWTEPPSGEVPRILIDEDEPPPPDEDLSAWGALGAQPRWRDQPTDWEDADFSDAILTDEAHRVGALRTGEGDAPFSFDEPEPEAPPESPYERPGTPGRARISTLPTGGARPLGPPGGRAQGGAGGSDVTTRVVTGGVAVAVLLLAAVIGPKALVLLVAVALTMSAAELFQGLRTRGYHPATLLGLVGTASLVGAVYWKGLDAYPLVLALFVVFTLLWYLTGVVRARPAMNVAVTLLVFLYVGFLGSFAALILTAGRPGARLLLGAILATIAYDIGAFFVGRWAGKTPLAPDISPNKTVEGLVGASVATLLVCLVIVSNIDPWDGGKAFWLAIMVCVAAPLGDLCESMIKRDLDVKDMGNVLPGHGGVLDRIDALLFVIPGTFYLARLVF